MTKLHNDNQSDRDEDFPYHFHLYKHSPEDIEEFQDNPELLYFITENPEHKPLQSFIGSIGGHLLTAERILDMFDSGKPVLFDESYTLYIEDELCRIVKLGARHEFMGEVFIQKRQLREILVDYISNMKDAYKQCNCPSYELIIVC